MSRYQVRTIESLAEFNQIGSEWNRLVKSTPLDHSYMRHEWFACWIEAYNVGDDLAVVTLWDGNTLRAAAPLRRVREVKRGIEIRTLKFLQSPVSPRCNIICSTIDEMEQTLRAIYSLSKWDLLVLENLESGMPPTDFLTDMLNRNRNIRGRITEGRHSPFMAIAGTWDEYLTSLNSARRGFIKNECIKRLGKAKSYSLRHLRSGQDSDSVFAIMHDVSDRSWKGAEGTAIGQLTTMQTFYETFMPVGLRLGYLDVVVLEIEGTVVGFDCCLTHGTHYSGIRSDFDMQFKYYHPGENMRIEVIKHLFDSGQPAEYDMGGDPAPYKMKWANGVRKHVNITIVNNTLRGRGIAFSRYVVKPFIEKLMKRPKPSDQSDEPTTPQGSAE